MWRARTKADDGQAEGGAVQLGAVGQDDGAQAGAAHERPRHARLARPAHGRRPHAKQQQHAHAERPAAPHLVVIGIDERHRLHDGGDGGHQRPQAEREPEGKDGQWRQDGQGKARLAGTARGVQPRHQAKHRGDAAVKASRIPLRGQRPIAQAVDRFDVEQPIVVGRHLETTEGQPQQQRRDGDRCNQQ